MFKLNWLTKTAANLLVRALKYSPGCWEIFLLMQYVGIMDIFAKKVDKGWGTPGALLKQEGWQHLWKLRIAC